MKRITVLMLSRMLYEEFEKDAWGKVGTSIFRKPQTL